MIETTGQIDFSQVYGAHAGRPRALAVSPPAPIDAGIADAPVRSRPREINHLRTEAVGAVSSPSAALLTSMIERMGGAGTSSARGDHVDLRI